MRLTRNERILNTFCVAYDPDSFGSERYVVQCDGKRVGSPHPTYEGAIAEMQYHQQWWLLIYRSREGLSDEACAALDKLQRGEAPAFSTGICESLTAGYGKCDGYGYFEYPLPHAAAYMGVCDYLNKHKHLLLNKEF